MEYEKKKIVILGGGYAGLMTAVTLQKKAHPSRFEIFLVNNHNYHYFTTKVHQAGAGTVNPESIKLAITDLIDTEMITFIEDELVSLDLERRKVTCKNNTLDYDYVVLAIGGAPKTFDIPGVKENAFFLFDWEGTNRLRKHIEEQFEHYQNQRDGKLNIVIAGTGFTGMEFIHELKEQIPVLCEQYSVNQNDVHLIVIEPNNEILQGYPEAIVLDAEKSMQTNFCELTIGVPVQRVESDKVILEDGMEIPTNTFIWAGGVRGNPILEGLGFETLDGRVKLNKYCEVPGLYNVYVLGDASVSFDENGQPYPPTAQIAIQQGQYCGYSIARKVYGQPVKPFHYIYRGMVMSLGKRNASGIVYDHEIHGRFAHFMKWVIEMRYYFMLGGLRLVRKQMKE